MRKSTKTQAPKLPAACRRFAKAKAIAAKLGVCSKTVFRLADQGRLHRHKLNARVVLFDEDEVDALIASSRVA